MKNYIYSFLLLLITASIDVSAQRESPTYVPKVGEKVRDFEFKQVYNYPASSFKISDFKGKWVILDFWSYGCVGCVASFPKMDEIHRKFKDQVQLVMVGLYSHKYKKLTEQLYADRKAKLNLDFTVALDSNAQEAFNVSSVPMILIIDPNGIIRASSVNIVESDISAFLNGNTPATATAYPEEEKKRNREAIQ